MGRPVTGAATLRRLPLWFAANIRPRDDGRFTLDPDGTEAHVVPVRDRAGALADMVAWLPDDPFHWWTKCGESAVLGAREIAGAALAGMPVPLQPTPAHWLAAGGRGVVVLDWSVNLLPIFQDVGRIALAHLEREEAIEARRRLRQNFWQSIPQIGGRDAR